MAQNAFFEDFLKNFCENPQKKVAQNRIWHGFDKDQTLEKPSIYRHFLAIVKILCHLSKIFLFFMYFYFYYNINNIRKKWQIGTDL